MKKAIVLGILLCVGAFADDSKPKYGAGVALLRDSHDYISKHKATDYWNLSANYVPQITGSACTSASVVMALNALRTPSKLKASDALVTQKNIHDVLKNDKWRKAVDEKGGGANLDDLGKVIEEALPKYGFKYSEVKVVHVNNLTEEMKKKVHDLLVENEASSRNILLANFLQSEFTGDPEGAVGHVAPVGAYDEANKKVLIMDPDRDWYEPYWVSEETFLKGMNTKDSDGKEFRGLIYMKVNQ